MAAPCVPATRGPPTPPARRSSPGATGLASWTFSSAVSATLSAWATSGGMFPRPVLDRSERGKPESRAASPALTFDRLCVWKLGPLLVDNIYEIKELRSFCISACFQLTMRYSH